MHASRSEREALINSFAAEFLLPRGAVRAQWSTVTADPGNGRTAAVRLSARYRVSWTLTLQQLRNARAVGAEPLTRWRNTAPTRAELLDAAGWEPRPDLLPGQVPPRYARAVLAAFAHGLINAARTVELLHGQVTAEDLPPRQEDAE